MPRGVRRQITYTGEAAKIHDKIIRHEEELKTLRENLKTAVKRQEQEAKVVAKKKQIDEEKQILKLIKESGKTTEEIIALLEQ